ncbi:MAG TPA: kelch repeat-containing protein, partial [Flavobacteriales bacterium]|nr:kelch repeat-containing protein [Flavobacteriales bacterium]
LSAFAQTWTQLPDFPGTARDDAASFSIGGKVYVGTGMDVGFSLTNDWYAFDTWTETWDVTSPLPGTSRQYCSGFSINDFGYLFGGVDASGPLNELWRYDPNTDIWQQRAALPAAGRYATAAFNDGVYGYICTGMLDGGVPTNEVWRYDPVSDNWTSRSPVPGPARHRATSSGGDVIGGADAGFQALADGYSYNSISDAWSAIADLPQARFGARAYDRLIVAGASSQSAVHNDVWMYSYPDNNWTNYVIPAFSGGARRDGVIGIATNVADMGIWYFGTGSDNAQRYRDWWKLVSATGFNENSPGSFIVFPNPANDRITIRTPRPAALGTCDVIDATGRIIISTSVHDDQPIAVAQLSPGRYEVVVRSSDVLWRSPLIKLP